MSIPPEEQTYRTYILTLWQIDKETRRFVLKDPQSTTRIGFATIGALVDYLLDTKITDELPPEKSETED